MNAKNRNFLKKLFPPTAQTFSKEVGQIHSSIHEMKDLFNTQYQNLHQEHLEQTQQLVKAITDLQEAIIVQNNEIKHLVQDQYSTQVKNYASTEKELRITILNDLKDIIVKQNLLAKKVNEVIWGHIFNNTISDSAWLTDKAFSPGRWAVGYPYLYALYRILSEVQPLSILELGLGQSTRMIAQYAQAKKEVKHIVIEQDETWIAFFQNNYSVSDKSEIVYLPTKEITFLDDDHALVYDGFENQLSNNTFDLICIDGPAHSKSSKYRRIDLLGIIPDSLASSFAIILDDLNVPECEKAYKLIEQKLKEMNVPYYSGTYYGEKAVLIICSEGLKFLCSM